MATVDKEQPIEADQAERRDGPNWVVWITTITAVLSVLVGGGALLRDYFGWERTDPDGGRTPAGLDGASHVGGATVPMSGAANPSPSVTKPTGVHLDSLPVKAGAGNIVELPRPLTGQAGLDRAIAVRCPQNTAQDKQREVTYELRRRYQDLTVTVRAYSPDDPPAAVRLTVNVAVRRADGTVDRLARGSADARQDAPGRLTADVAGADDLTLRVECESPASVVMLADARITSA
ncbi:hypothetical protein ACL02O_09295 [Micromonospora sp. MS34]|uniref:hypothetical protein n=1 Tax=Micromonospora sp. MS34 TaxID=3385971 RepID=UPI00399F0505